MDQSVRLHRRDLVIDRRQFLIFGSDQLHGPLGDMRIARQHDRDRLADMTHLVERQDRLVVKGRAVIGLRDELADVFAGDDAIARLRRARRGVSMRRMRPCGTVRAKYLAVKHARQPQIVGVLGAPGDLGADFEPRNGSPDLIHRCTYRASSAKAWRTARLR